MYMIHCSDDTCQLAFNLDNVMTHFITNEYEKYFKKQGYSKTWLTSSYLGNRYNFNCHVCSNIIDICLLHYAIFSFRYVD